MKNELLIGAVVVVGMVALTLFYRNATVPTALEKHPAGGQAQDKVVKKDSTSAAPGRSAQNKPGANNLPDSAREKGGKISGSPGVLSGDIPPRTPDESGEDSLGPGQDMLPEIDGEIPEVVTVNDQAETLAMVNGRPVAITDIMPPGSFDQGDMMPEESYKALLDKAIDQTLLLQKAEELEGEGSDTFAVVSDYLGKQYEEMDLGGSPEENKWLVRNLTSAAIVSDLFQQEGLIPERVSDEEVQQYYDSNSVEYEWLRKRESARGTTPEIVERRVKEQIRQDLQEPRLREAMEKQKEYVEVLRERADIEYLE